MSLATEIQIAKNKATDQWRELVHAAAAGTEPSLAALAKVAEGLGVTTHQAAAKLQADTELVQQCRWYESQRDAINARIEAALAPYGDEPGFRAAVEEAESNARALREAYNALTRQTMVSAGTAEGTLRRLMGSRPDLFTN
jgi:hypothetical protein